MSVLASSNLAVEQGSVWCVVLRSLWASQDDRLYGKIIFSSWIAYFSLFLFYYREDSLLQS